MEEQNNMQESNETTQMAEPAATPSFGQKLYMLCAPDGSPLWCSAATDKVACRKWIDSLNKAKLLRSPITLLRQGWRILPVYIPFIQVVKGDDAATETAKSSPDAQQ